MRLKIAYGRLETTIKLKNYKHKLQTALKAHLEEGAPNEVLQLSEHIPNIPPLLWGYSFQQLQVLKLQSIRIIG